jgi:branched-chain amino acid transport system substrate-binding protein
MDAFVSAFKARYNVPPSDWAVMAYDAVTLWADGVRKAHSFDGTAVSNAMSGMTFDSTRGPLTVRALDHQVNCAEYEGTLQADESVGFDTFAGVTAVPGSQTLLTPDQVTALRNGS